MSGRHFRNPVSLAKLIMYESPHCAFSANGARQFAERHGFPICNPDDLISQFARERVNISYEYYLDFVKHHYEGVPMQVQDTVSAVAMDINGHLACATSTGKFTLISTITLN